MFLRMVALSLVLALGRGLLAQENQLITNLGALSVRALDENRVVYRVPETLRREDLNGDGDLGDSVIHLRDFAKDETTNLRLAGTSLALSDEVLAIEVSEVEQSEDLNGDGDAGDSVIHLYRLATGETTNLKLAGRFFSVFGSWLVFEVGESQQSEDLNSDGDTQDDVVHLHNLSTGETRNLELTGFPRWDGDWLALSVSEFEQGKDLNGDGDVKDTVVHVHNLSTGETRNLLLAGYSLFISGDWLVLNVAGYAQVHNLATGETTNLMIPEGGGPLMSRIYGNWLVIPFYEHTTREDRNGDGDTRDAVLHVHNLTAGETVNLRTAVGHFFYVSEDWLVFNVLESQEGVDLNGDGEIRGDVLHIYNLATGETMVAGRNVRTEENWLVYSVFEALRGADLNGDGDTADTVVHVHNLVTGETRNLRLAARGITLSGNWAALAVSEPEQGADLNDDGDTEDAVLHIYDIATGETRNLRLAGESLRFSGDWLVLHVAETGQGADLNGDGDTEDAVLHVHNVPTGETRNLRRTGSMQGASGDWLVLDVSELGEGEDLNGDGDTEDEVFHLHNFATSATTNLRLAWEDLDLGRLLGPALFYDEWVLLEVSERRQGADLNGDGDTEDRVYHLVDLGRLSNLPVFVRGDPNGDGTQNLTDAVFILEHLFGGGEAPSCAKSADADDSGTVDLTDPVFLLNSLFLGGPQSPAPFPECGPDSTIDELDCEAFKGCA